MKDSRGLTEGYIKLCVAIVNSGIKQNDQFFLKSEWCQELISYILEYNNNHKFSIRRDLYEKFIKLYKGL